LDTVFVLVEVLDEYLTYFDGGLGVGYLLSQRRENL